MTNAKDVYNTEGGFLIVTNKKNVRTSNFFENISFQMLR